MPQLSFRELALSMMNFRTDFEAASLFEDSSRALYLCLSSA